MSWSLLMLPLASADWLDTAAKAIAAGAVVAGPTLVVWLTRRGNRADRTTVERTEVEKLYIAGSQDLIKHLQGLLVAATADLASARTKCRMLQEELDVANRSMVTYESQYERLLAVLRQSGVNLPEDLKE